MNTLVDRYVAAATEHLPETRRIDVAHEIRTAIDELVEQRLDAGASEDTAIRESLTELGNPAKFAAAYEDTPRYLIGPGWYPAYIALLKKLVPIVLLIVASVAIIADLALGDSESTVTFGNILTGAIDAVYNAGIQVLLWVTVGFIIAERTLGPEGPVTISGRWTVDDLPEQPAQRHIGLGETLLEVVALIIAGVLVTLQHTQGFGIVTGSGISEATRRMPLFNPDLAGSAWAYGFYILLAISIAASVARYWRGVWTPVIFLASVVDDVLWIAFIAFLASAKPIFNIELMQKIGDIGDIWGAGERANATVAAIVIAISAWSIWEAWTGFRQHRKSRSV